MRFFGIISIVILCLISNRAFASKGHPYASSLAKLITENFIDGGRVSAEKLKRFSNLVEKSRTQVIGPKSGITDETPSLLVSQFRRTGLSGEKLIKKVTGHELNVVYDLIENHVQKASQAVTTDSAIYELGQALGLLRSIRIQGDTLLIEELKRYTLALSTSWKILKNPKPEQEASNLIAVGNTRFLTNAEIAAERFKNTDLSKLNPEKDSAFWQDPGAINKINIKLTTKGVTHPLYQGLNTQFPANNEFEFSEVIKSQSKPKIEIYQRGPDGKKQKYKLKIGFEMHADPTASSLLLAAGFPTDLTQYRRNIIVKMDKNSWDEMVSEWESYYSRDSLIRPAKIEDYIAERGENYVVFKEGLLEPKHENLMRIGPWSFDDFHTHREVRGMTLFHIWYGNMDLKPMDNNRLIIRKYKGGAYKVFQGMTDTGASFSNYGAYMTEKFELLSSDIISADKNSHLTLNYKSAYAPNGITELTWSDARWATRLIGQFTHEQIKDAVDLGSWPECARPMIVQKLISRRNQLVQKLGLTREMNIINTPHVYTKKEVNECVQSKEVKENYISDFDFNFGTLFNPAKKGAWNLLMSAIGAGIGEAKTLTIKPTELGIEEDLISQVIINFQREVEDNPNQSTFEDRFLVRDSLTIGFRLGINFGLYADREIRRKYSLVYPVRTKADAQVNNGFIANILLPFQIAKGNLPERYVLSTEHYANWRTGIRASNFSETVGPGLELGGGFANLWRSVLDHRDPQNIRLFRERSKQLEESLRLYFRFGILKWPFLQTAENWGKGRGYGYNISENEMKNSSFSEDLYKAFALGDFTSLDKRKKSFEFDDNYNERTFDLWLLLYGIKNRKSSDAIHYKSEERDEVSYQNNHYHRAGWRFIDNGEYREHSVKVYANPTDNKYSYSIDSSFVLEDKITNSNELENIYLRHINEIARDGNKLIDFSPTLGFSSNNHWGHTFSYINLRIHSDGVAKLMQVSNNQFWAALTKVTGQSRSDIENKISSYLAHEAARKKGGSSVAGGIYAPLYGLKRHELRFLSATVDLIRGLNNLKKKANELEKIKLLSKLLRDSLYKEKKNGRSGVLARVLLNLVDKNDYYLEVGVKAPEGIQKRFIEDEELWGAEGINRPLDGRYLIHAVESPSDLYFMLENWF